MPTALPRKTELFAVGRLNRKRRAMDSLPLDRLSAIRHRMAGASMKAAVDGLLSVALMYAQVARAIDRATGSPNAMSEAEWTSILTFYARRGA